MRRILALLSLALLAACSSSSSSTGTSDANPCPDPTTVVTGGSCDVTIQCTAAEKCLQCGQGSYIKDAQSCSCSSGKWQCPIYDCGPFKPGTYSDASCTTLNPEPIDAGADASDASDANEAG